MESPLTGTEVARKLEVLGQMADLLAHTQLTAGGRPPNDGGPSPLTSAGRRPEPAGGAPRPALQHLASLIQRVPPPPPHGAPDSSARTQTTTATATTTSTTVNGRGKPRRGPEAAVEGDGEAFCYAAGLQLPRSCGAEVAAALGELGLALQQACQELRAAVECQLVDFFEHLRDKQVAELEEISAARKMVPLGFEVRGDCASPSLPPAGNTAGRFDFFRDVAAPDEDAELEKDLRGWRNTGAADALPHLAAPPADRGQIVCGSSETAATFAKRRPADPAAWREKGGGVKSKASGGGRLAQDLAHSRSAASTLQSFLYLLLEAALTQCEATCGAVFINEATAADAGSPSPSHQSDINNAHSSGNAQNGGASQPRFLRSIAHINTEGYLPQTVSYATTSTLTTVAQTGVALNLRNSIYSVGGKEAGGGDGRHSRRGGRPPTQQQHGADLAPSTRYLNVNNCVAVPIRHFGVVVVANKRRDADGGGDFTSMDEHVAWSVSMLCANLLMRYRRELLLDFVWSPTGIQELRRYSLLSPVSGVHRRVTTLGAGGRQSISFTASSDADNDSSATGDDIGMQQRNRGIVSFIAAKQADHSVTRALAVVRTADERTLKAVPTELLPRRNNVGSNHGTDNASHDGKGAGDRVYSAVTGRRVAAPPITSVREEDLYEGAARYIANLENLWRQSLEEQTSLHSLVQLRDAESEAGQVRMKTLEAKVQRLNARIIQLERSPTALQERE